MQPTLQSRILLTVALLGMVAVEVASASYAWQTASTSQVVLLAGFALQTDVMLKVLFSVAGGASAVLGPPIVVWLWTRGSERSRRQAMIAVAATLAGAIVTITNLSGYFAHVRAQREVDIAISSPLYRVAMANAERVERGELPYLQGADRSILLTGERAAAASRSSGDVWRAILTVSLISGMAGAYRLGRGNSAAKVRKRRRRRKQPTPLRVVK